MSTNATVSNFTPNTALVDSNGIATFAFLKWMQNVGGTVNANFDPKGNYQGPIGARATIDGRATLASIVQFLDTGGIMGAAGIDFARAYLNKDTDHIADGSGSPLAGGRAAYTALLASPPAVTPHRWLTGLVGGVFVNSQPGFGDLTGTAVPGQVPPLYALTGQITAGQFPAGGIAATITTAKLTGGGTTGSMTFDATGRLTAQVQAT